MPRIYKYTESTPPESDLTPDMQPSPSSRLDAVTTYYFADKLREIAAMEAAGTKVINLGIGSPDLPPHPEVINALAAAAANPANHGYQSYRGIPELRRAFSAWYGRTYGVQPDPESEVLPLIGSKEGIMHLSMAFLQKGDRALVPDPGYPTYAAATRLAGGDVVHYDLTPERGYFPDLEALGQTDLTKVKLMWVNYPHMPTGARASRAQLSALIRFAERHHILLCHDNPYNAILNPDPVSIMSLPGGRDHAVELNSLSKTFNMAGWRIGVMTGKKEIIDTVVKFKSNMDSGMFKPLQIAAVTALEAGPEWMNALNAVYAKRRSTAVALLQRLGCSPEPDQSGLFVWAAVPPRFETAEMLTEHVLHRYGVFLVPGRIFGRNGERYLRISLCAKNSVLRAALNRIAPFNPEEV